MVSHKTYHTLKRKWICVRCGKRKAKKTFCEKCSIILSLINHKKYIKLKDQTKIAILKKFNKMIWRQK